MDRSVKWLVGSQVVLLGLLMAGGYFVYERITAQDSVLQELQRKLDALGSKIEEAHLTVCNLSLFSVGWSAAVRVSEDRTRLRSGDLESGECERRTVYHRPGFGEIYVYGYSASHDQVAIEANKKVNALFAGYAPAAHPTIAFLVLMEDAREGSLNAIPVAKDVLRWYYENRITKTSP